jgi:hypothetical protein
VTPAPSDWWEAQTRDVRANRAYRLFPLDTLPARHREALQSAGAESSAIFGLLIAEPGSGLPEKAVDNAGAALFAQLRKPGRLAGVEGDRLAQLVLDGVLEIDSEDGFVSGPRAYAAVGGLDERPGPEERLGRLSRAALDYAARLKLPTVEQTAARLYCFNRVAMSRRWRRAYPHPQAVHDLLRGPTLSRHWVEHFALADGAPDWLSWSRRGEPQGRTRMRYKLYVSPAVDELPDVLTMLVDALTGAGARHFKIGPNAAGLVRPDKIVIYLDDATELAAVGSSLDVALRGVRPHGVPFTAEFAADGLLSWGGDPAGGSGPLGAPPESWRQSVSRRLAEYLHAGRRAAIAQVSPTQFALARLAADGVDVRAFAPTDIPAPVAPPPVVGAR